MQSPDIKVVILMASRNGAAWLGQQLASIAAQDHANWELWVSDDGSQDATRQILRDFASARAGQNRVVVVEGPGLGSAGANFLHLLCRPELPLEGDTYVAFADQDDIWYPGKLSRALAVLAGVPGPALYGGQSRHVTEDGRPTGGASRRPSGGAAGQHRAPLCSAGEAQGARTAKDGDAGREDRDASAGGGDDGEDRDPACLPAPPLGNLLVQNLVSGHSAVLNPAGAALARSCGVPKGVAFHDWWLAQLIHACGGRICIDAQTVLDYRQHGRNTLGGPLGLAALRHRLRLLRQRAYAGWIAANLAALAEAPLTDKARRLTEALRALPGAGPFRLAGFRRLGLARQSRAGTLALYLSALLGLA